MVRISKMVKKEKKPTVVSDQEKWKLVVDAIAHIESKDIPSNFDEFKTMASTIWHKNFTKRITGKLEKGVVLDVTDEMRAKEQQQKVDNQIDLSALDEKPAATTSSSEEVGKKPISSSEVDFEKFKQFTEEFRRLFDDLVEADVWRYKDKCKDKTCRCTRCNTEQYQRPKAYHDAKEKILTFIRIHVRCGANRDWQRLQSLYMVFYMMWNHKNKNRIPLYTGLLVACGWKFEALSSVSSSGVKYLNNHSLFFKGDVDNKHGMDETTSTFTITKRKTKNCTVRLDGLRGVRRFKGRKVVNNWYKDNVNCNMNQVFYGLRSTWDNRDLSFERECDTYKTWLETMGYLYQGYEFKKYVMYTCRSGNGGGTHDDVRWAIRHCH